MKKTNQIISAIAVLACLASVPVMGQKTLGEATKGKFLFGVAVNSRQFNGINPVETELIAKEFSAIVGENCMKPQPIHPEENRYNWEDADKLVSFGEKNNQVVTGHCLVWHSQIGKWMFVDD